MKRFTAVLALVVTLCIAVSPTAHADTYTSRYWNPWGEAIKDIGTRIKDLYDESPGLFMLASPYIVAGSVGYVAVMTLPFAVTTMFWSAGRVGNSFSGDDESSESDDD